jgi:hypothetical protein
MRCFAANTHRACKAAERRRRPLDCSSAHRNTLTRFQYAAVVAAVVAVALEEVVHTHAQNAITAARVLEAACRPFNAHCELLHSVTVRAMH